MLKKIITGVILAVMLLFVIQYIYPQKMKLKVGDTVPSFTLKDQDNQEINIADYKGKNAMVIYFYPKDDTPGCTKEACRFRDEFEAFTDLEVKVIGISADDVGSHKKFADKYKLPFTLLADTENKVRKLFGVPRNMLGLIPGRVTYIVDKKGTIVHIFNSQFGAEKHITVALSKLKE